ncbi:MAG: hypothetical protein AAGA90_16280 [Actinomycetota bacterium]
MLQPTGSVYLDAPRPPSRRPAPEPTGPRVVVSAVLAAVGLVCLTIAATLGLFRALVHDPDTIMGSIDEALDDPAGRADFEAEIAAAIGGTMFGEELSQSLAAYGIDVDAEAERIAPMVLDDATFRAALTDLVITTHDRVVLESTDEPLDMTAITSAVRAIIVREIPEADAVLPASSTLYIVTADQIPDITAPIDLLDRAALAVAIGGLLLPLAYLAHPERHQVVRWLGRWLLVLGVVAGGAALGLPWMASRVTGSELVEIAVRDLSTRLLAPAAVAGIVGIGLVFTASMLRSRQPSSVADVGVAAALGGLDHAWTIPTTETKEMELAQRGLVDVSHPLTNI